MLEHIVVLGIFRICRIQIEPGTYIPLFQEVKCRLGRSSKRTDAEVPVVSLALDTRTSRRCIGE